MSSSGGWFPVGQSASQHVIAVAWFCGTFLSSLVIGLMVVVLCLRGLLIFEQRRRKRFLKLWQPLLLESLVQQRSAEFPRIKQRDWLTLLLHWNHLHGFMRGDAKERLIAIGHELGMVAVARRMLTRRSIRPRLIALLTLGNLKANFSWHALERLTASSDSYLSLSAMRAMVAIDPDTALPVLVPEIARRTDWSPVLIATVLQEAGYERVAPLIAAHARRELPDRAAHLIRFLSPAQCTGAGPILRQILLEATSERLISVCLQALKEPEDLEIARRFLSHEQWFIRVQAASAVGRLGLPGDEAALTALLSDQEWWVRYRAAQALAALPWISLADLATVGTDHPDRYARDIMIQVMAEAVVQ